jgi:hypothetical protein
MKKILLVLLCAAAVQNYAFSQNVLGLLSKNSKLMFGPTWSNWAEVPAGVEVKPARNIGFDIAATHRFGKGTFGFITGLGISSINIHSNIKPWWYDSSWSSNSIFYLKMDSVRDGKKYYQTNKIALTYLEIPLEISMVLKEGEDTDSTNSKTGFKLAIGFRPGICIDAHTTERNQDFTRKFKDFDNIVIFRYGPTIRVGYGNFSLYGRYDLNSTFEGEKVPKYSVYTVGLIISGM